MPVSETLAVIIPVNGAQQPRHQWNCLCLSSVNGSLTPSVAVSLPHLMRPTPASGTFTVPACPMHSMAHQPTVTTHCYLLLHIMRPNTPINSVLHVSSPNGLQHPLCGTRHSGLPHWGPVIHHQHPRLASAELVQETWSACALHSTLPSTVFSANTNLFKVLEKYLIRVEIHLTLRVCGVREDWCGEAAVCGGGCVCTRGTCCVRRFHSNTDTFLHLSSL